MSKRLQESRSTNDPSICAICDKSGQRIGDWKIIPNSFPYDLIASRHDLLVPVRHIAAEEALTGSELAQLKAIKASSAVIAKYSLLLENLGDQRSIKKHLHLHLIRLNS